MPHTTQLHSEYTKALSTGQSYFNAIFNGRKDFNLYKSGSVEGLLTELNARTISENLVSH